ncbi:hypothetical protein S40293_02286 [Stachybotrys chartarum IBT 40293]|nr:hypothetical protein S40293_02286 [Stachybotrys chartarum IBT 40293]
MATETVKAAVLHGPRDLRIVSSSCASPHDSRQEEEDTNRGSPAQEERQIAAPGADELQVAVKATGICGSDQHYYNHYRNGDILVREPMALGHESAGVVVAVGSNSQDAFKVGDRVALEVGLPCGQCKLCSQGRYNICKGMSFRSSAKSFPHFQGTLQERINHPAKWCHKLPDNVSLDEGSLLEPLSVAIHAVRRARQVKGSRTLVIGAGAVGLLVAAMLRVEEASSITIADIEGSRVTFATDNNFADAGVVVPRKRPASDSAVDKLSLAQETAALFMEQNGGEQYDIIFECTGVEACLQASIYSATAGGAVMLIGMGTPVQTLPISAAALREVDLIGVFRYADTYPYGLSVLADRGSGRLPDVGKLVSHRFDGFDKVTDAFAAAGKPVGDDGKLVLKVMIGF